MGSEQNDQPATQADKVLEMGKAKQTDRRFVKPLSTKSVRVLLGKVQHWGSVYLQGQAMTQPKLREGYLDLIYNKSCEFVDDYDELFGTQHSQISDAGVRRVIFMTAAKWTLNNLHLLLEPRDQPLVNGKRVAIVEVSE